MDQLNNDHLNHNRNDTRFDRFYRPEQEVPYGDSFLEMNRVNFQQPYGAIQVGCSMYSYRADLYPRYDYENGNGQYFQIPARDQITPNRGIYHNPVNSQHHIQQQSFSSSPLTLDGNSGQAASTYTTMTPSSHFSNATGGSIQECWQVERMPYSCPPRIEFETLNLHERSDRSERSAPSRERYNQFPEDRNGRRFPENGNSENGTAYVYNIISESDYASNGYEYGETSAVRTKYHCGKPPKRYRTKSGPTGIAVSPPIETLRVYGNIGRSEREKSAERKRDSDCKRKKNMESVRKHRRNLMEYIKNGPNDISFLESKIIELDEVVSSAETILGELHFLMDYRDPSRVMESSTQHIVYVPTSEPQFEFTH